MTKKKDEIAMYLASENVSTYTVEELMSFTYDRLVDEYMKESEDALMERLINLVNRKKELLDE